MLDKFSRWWGVENDIPPYADVIALVSFGATKTRMTHGLQKVVHMGCTLQKMYPYAKIVFGEFTENPTPEIEHRLKKKVFPEGLYAGPVISTIEEGEAWLFRLPCRFEPEHIIICTDEMHSRSARRVSNRVWNGIWYKRLWKWTLEKPVVQIHMKTFPTRFAIDPESPMTALRDQWLWTRNNVLRELFLMFVPFGYTIMKKLNVHQPVTK